MAEKEFAYILQHAIGRDTVSAGQLYELHMKEHAHNRRENNGTFLV